MTVITAPETTDRTPEWALVDVETSGLRAAEHRVLSLAVITVDEAGRQTGEFSTLLDPGCDPGPVEVHGLTRERLRGAPRFEHVAGRVAELLQGRVMVAHNAQFDYDFLAREFGAAGSALPVSRRLCTVALNRRLGTPTDNLRLGTLAAFYGVRQLQAHDALDDTRVLAGVLRGSLAEAVRLGVSLPLVDCPPRRASQYRPSIPKTPCAFRNPGRWQPGGALVQGMKVAVTGETGLSREELVAEAVTAGLNVMTAVSKHTSVLVANDLSSGSAKVRRAVSEGVPVLDEAGFRALLPTVRAGAAQDGASTAPARSAPTPVPEATGTPAAAAAPVAAAPPPRPAAPVRPLTGRRVLVLGGTHPVAASVRTRVVELGGSAAVNLSANVSDVVLLPGGEADRRLTRIGTLGLIVHELAWLDAPQWTTVEASGPQAPVLPRGGVIDLPAPTGGTGSRWQVDVSWAQQTRCEVDVVAFAVDEDEQVSCDEDFVFYGAPENPGGSVLLAMDGPTEQSVTVDLAALPFTTRKVVVAAAVDGTVDFGEVGAIELTVGRGDDGGPLAQATLDAATTERTMLLAELYRRGPSWRLRAVGQGFDHGLDALARFYGVDIEG
ncbi:TerD family protein [Kitasatospora sp. NPDC002040]|uniref:TerD family protein n=1 Tax=Kitasatospora sp. NPDC002040 TaxID=3154661 RepID=UPI00331E3562